MRQATNETVSMAQEWLKELTIPLQSKGDAPPEHAVTTHTATKPTYERNFHDIIYDGHKL